MNLCNSQSQHSNFEEINKKEKNHEISGLERGWLIVRKSGTKISVLMNGQILEGEVVCQSSYQESGIMPSNKYYCCYFTLVSVVV